MSEQQALKSAAESALSDYSGCSSQRAEAIVKEVADQAVGAALRQITGEDAVTTSVVDQRVTRLQALTEKLGELSTDEIGGIFRLTPTQAGTLARTFEARAPAAVRTGRDKRLSQMVPTVDRRDDVPLWRLDFSSKVLLDHAVAALRRGGVEQGVDPDPRQLTLRVPQEAVDRDDNRVDPLDILNIAQP